MIESTKSEQRTKIMKIVTSVIEPCKHYVSTIGNYEHDIANDPQDTFVPSAVTLPARGLKSE